MRVTEGQLRRIIREVMVVSDGKPSDATDLILKRLNTSEWFERFKAGHKRATGEDLPPLTPWELVSKNKNPMSGNETSTFVTVLDPDESDSVSLTMKVLSTEKANDYEYYVKIDLIHHGRGTGAFDRPTDNILSKTFTSSAAFMKFILNLDIQDTFQKRLRDTISLPTPKTPIVKESSFRNVVTSLRKSIF